MEILFHVIDKEKSVGYTKKVLLRAGFTEEEIAERIE